MWNRCGMSLCRSPAADRCSKLRSEQMFTSGGSLLVCQRCTPDCHTLTKMYVDTLNVTSVACDYPIRDRHQKFDILGISMGIFTTFVVGARLFQKIRFERLLRLDDWVIVFCLVTCLGNTVTCVYGLSGNGFGRDAWTNTPYTITEFLRVSCFSRSPRRNQFVNGS
jgi:hypothetical protein